jgi:hypothetical protein
MKTIQELVGNVEVLKEQRNILENTIYNPSATNRAKLRELLVFLDDCIMEATEPVNACPGCGRTDNIMHIYTISATRTFRCQCGNVWSFSPGTMVAEI